MPPPAPPPAPAPAPATGAAHRASTPDATAETPHWFALPGIADAPGPDGAPTSPVLFAEDAVAEALATYRRALQAFIDTDPERYGAAIHEADAPLTLLDEAAIGLFVSAWNVALALGYERAERARWQRDSVGFVPRRLCRECDGHGRPWPWFPSRPEDAPAAPSEPCATCGGSGVEDRPAIAAYQPGTRAA